MIQLIKTIRYAQDEEINGFLYKTSEYKFVEIEIG